MGEKGERELLAIVFTDAVGSSSQTALDEDKSLSMLMADLDSIRNEAAARGGSVLKNTGDGLLISFKSAVDAIECALSIQKAFQGRPKGQGFQHKIGVHIGDVIKKDGDIYGAGVNTASRLVDQCAPGGICLSSTLYELTKQKSEIGQLKLKDFLLQNTEPPILAYRSHGEKSTDNDKNKDQTTGKPAASNKLPRFIVGLVILLVAGALAIAFQKIELTRKNSDYGNLYGFEYKSGPAEGLKSTPNGAPLMWTLENNSDASLELRWYDCNGRPKVSDDLNQELLRLGPGNKFQGKTYRGHAFALFDSQTQEMLGSFRVLHGEKINLVVEKNNNLISVEPKYLRKAIAGDSLAQAKLSEMFWTGNGLPQNDKEALRWATLSFERGNSFGICMMAALLDAGSGVPVDYKRALGYWQQAAKAGEPWAYARLGDRYLYGIFETPKDYEQAVRWLTMSRDRGNDWATANLGRCFEKGWGVPIDRLRARQLYQEAAKNGNREGVAYLKELLKGMPIPETVGSCKYHGEDFSVSIESSNGLAFYRLPENVTHVKFSARVETPRDLSLFISGPGNAPIFSENNKRESLNAILGGWKNSKSIFQKISQTGDQAELVASTRLGALPEVYDCEALYGPEGFEIRVDGKSLIKTKELLNSKPEYFCIGTCWDVPARLSNILIEFR